MKLYFTVDDTQDRLLDFSRSDFNNFCATTSSETFNNAIRTRLENYFFFLKKAPQQHVQEHLTAICRSKRLRNVSSLAENHRLTVSFGCETKRAETMCACVGEFSDNIFAESFFLSASSDGSRYVSSSSCFSHSDPANASCCVNLHMIISSGAWRDAPARTEN